MQHSILNGIGEAAVASCFTRENNRVFCIFHYLHHIVGVNCDDNIAETEVSSYLLDVVFCRILKELMCKLAETYTLHSFF